MPEIVVEKAFFTLLLSKRLKEQSDLSVIPELKIIFLAFAALARSANLLGI